MNLKHNICVSLILFFLLGTTSSLLALEADDLVGIWKTADTEFGYSHVEIYKEDDKYHGKVVFLSNPTYSEKEAKSVKGAKEGELRKDLQNPDKELRDRNINGLKLVTGFKFNGRQWLGGQVYDPESGKTYKGKMWLNKNKTLGLRGFIGVSVFGRSTVWTRVKKATEEKVIKQSKE